MEVTSEEVHDGKVLKKLIDNASENNKVKRVLADGMYDSNNNFRYLSKNHIKPGIKTRLGEYVNARKFHNMTKELIIKASLYNMFVAMRM